MPNLVCVIEDQDELRKEIQKRLEKLGGLGSEVIVIGERDSWVMRGRLSRTEVDCFDKRVLLADLYSAGYWTEVLRSEGRRPKQSEKEDLMIAEGALDNIKHQLKPLVKQYGFQVVIYSHVFEYLRKKASLSSGSDQEGYQSTVDNMLQAVRALGIEQPLIIDKKRGHQVKIEDELESLVESVKALISV